MLLAGSQAVVDAVSRRPSAASSATTLSEILGRGVGFEEVAGAIMLAWGADAAPAAPVPGYPSRRTAFSDPAWTWRR
jgi:hypothetical protein